MTDNALEKAEKLYAEMSARIHSLEKELDLARSEKERAERFIKEWHDFMGTESELDPRRFFKDESGAREDTPKRIRPKNPAKEVVADAAIKIIREYGQPMPRDDLYDALDKHGIHIDGKDPQMVLSTMLWRQPDKIVRMKRGGYWPADDPVPEGEEVATKAAAE